MRHLNAGTVSGQAQPTAAPPAPEGSGPKRFGFLIHPLDMRDVIRFEPKAAGKREALVEKVLEWTPPYEASHITGVKSRLGTEAEGWFLAVSYMPRQFLALNRNVVMQKIIDAGRMAEARGAKIVGLGGFTSVVGDAGITVAKNLNIAVTSGNSYTIATALEGALAGARMMGIDLRKAHAAVIGASGSIGNVCAQFLAREVGTVTLIARNLPRLKKYAELIRLQTGKRVEVCTDVPLGIREADLIISASASAGSLIKPDALKTGCVVCDVALPHDVSPEVAEQRPDVLVIEGGLVQVPGTPNFRFDFGYPPGVALACMSETMILALEGREENFSLGRGITIERVQEIQRLAKKHGFGLAGFRSFGQWVSPEQVDTIKEAAKQRRKGQTFTVLQGGADTPS